MTEYDPCLLAPTCLYLASKAEASIVQILEMKIITLEALSCFKVVCQPVPCIISGLVDSMFRHIYALKEYNGPLFFANLFPTFNNDVSATLEKMTELLKANALDYQALSKYIIKLEGSAGFMGATRMRKACSGLRQACENKSFEGCRQAFNEIKCEYGALRNHFDIILKLEKALLASQAENRGKSSPASTCSSSSTS